MTGRPTKQQQAINDIESDRWLDENLAGEHITEIARREGRNAKSVWLRMQRARERRFGE